MASPQKAVPARGRSSSVPHAGSEGRAKTRKSEDEFTDASEGSALVSDTNDLQTRDRILDAAEALLRRHGLDKLTVTDIAQALKMSHGNIYRHFPSKAALRATVIERWLERIAEQTAHIATQDEPADIRLRRWLVGLAMAKQRKVIDDAEMLTAAARVVRETPEVEQRHAAHLHAQVVRILQDGLQDNTLPGVQDARAVATAILNATFRYHHPDQVRVGGAPDAQLTALNAIIALILGGLKAPT